MEMHDFIKEEKNKALEPPKPLRFLTRIEKPVPRPPTPSVEIPSPQEEERELAVIFLQQVLDSHLTLLTDHRYYGHTCCLFFTKRQLKVHPVRFC